MSWARTTFAKARCLFLTVLLGTAIASAAAQTPAPGAERDVQAPLDSPYAGRPGAAAPRLPADLDWINVVAPLGIESLRGKIVVFDFWTYGCINCIHMIPTLRRLEERYGDALAVIGVHSAKFTNEGETGNIRQIVQRYELHHPVINDSDFAVWRAFGVRAWPTFVIVDPRGNVVAQQAGEIPYDTFDEFLGNMVAFWDKRGELDRTPLALVPEGSGKPPGLLAFPGKVLADAPGGRLFIADTNHHRIVVASLRGYEVLDVIGSGERGFADGAYGAATFNKPQGMALRNGVLYVADTENHAIRAVDLAAKSVTTLAGTGKQGHARLPFGSRAPGRSTDLGSPWDLAFGADGVLYIAMAGPHQIWAMYPDEAHSVGPVVGDGREAALNGTLAASRLAQPSGLFYRDDVLYFADSESSTIRAANFALGRVETVAGTVDDNLFDFGDRDGRPGQSRLQHPLGVAGGETGPVYVADTYNSRIKAIDPATRRTTTLFGAGGMGGFRDGTGLAAQFDEPGGLTFAAGNLYVADTNNHAIRVIDLTARTVATVAFPNPGRLQIGSRTTVIGGGERARETVTLDSQTVAPGRVEIVVRIALAKGYKINPDAPSQVSFTVTGNAAAAQTGNVPFREPQIRLPITLSVGPATLDGVVTTYYCEAINESLCFFDEVPVTGTIAVADGAASREILVERTITPPKIPDI